jgi:hypothetical protein
MTRNDETLLEARACRCVELCITCDCNPTESPPINQAIRLPSATRYYLNRYREDLQPHAQAGHKTATSMLECCDYLLIESARTERLL